MHFYIYAEEVEVQLEIRNPSVLESDRSVTVYVRINQPFSQNINFIISPSDVTAIGENLLAAQLYDCTSTYNCCFLGNCNIVSLCENTTFSVTCRWYRLC